MSEYSGYNAKWGKKATLKYLKDKQHRVVLNWKKDEFERDIAPAIKCSGKTISGFIKEAVKEKIQRDNLNKGSL